MFFAYDEFPGLKYNRFLILCFDNTGNLFIQLIAPATVNQVFLPFTKKRFEYKSVNMFCHDRILKYSEYYPSGFKKPIHLLD